MLARTFEELEVWKRARTLTKTVFRVTASKAFRVDWGLRDQARRSSVSIMSNIAEGFERSSAKEFARFLDIAKGSCGELRAQLYVMQDAGLAEASKAAAMRSEAFEIGRMLHGLATAVRKNV